MTRSIQILCVRLIHWSIDRIRRKSPELRHEPVALVQTIGSRQIVVSASDRCRAASVRAGMSLAEAKALCGGLKHFPHDPQQDLKALHALGRWLMRFSPNSAPWPADAIMLDVSGCERLFGGLDVLMNQAAAAMARLRINARLAIAPTPTAAWAIASYGTAGQIVSSQELIESLSSLPVAALRIAPSTAADLKQLGIETIGQLLILPRQSLPARFGSELLHRLDAALGNVFEPLICLEHHAKIQASIEFDGEVDSTETMLLAMRNLLEELIEQLIRRGCGVRLLEARFLRMYHPPIDKTVRLSRPSRKASVLFNLLRCAYETVQSDAGFIGIRLGALDVARIDDEQWGLQEHQEQIAADELDRLIETLCTRLGPRSIVRPQLIESHLPELSCRRVEAQSAGVSNIPAPAVRPLRLLPAPMRISAMASPLHMPMSFTHQSRVHRLSYVEGPERISGTWWEGRDKTRDYFDVEDQDGRRFWLFRVVQTGRWYLHGLFV